MNKIEYRSFGDGYIVSSEGTVFSDRGKTRRELKTRLIQGYKAVNVWINGKRKTEYVHRIVATAFIPNPNNLDTVYHIDMNKLNNNVSNLRWLTGEENIRIAQTGVKHIRGHKIRQQGLQAEEEVRKYLLSLPQTILLTKLSEGDGQRPADFLWVTSSYACLVEVKSTDRYAGNIKTHQMRWMLKLRKTMPCYYAFVLDGEVYLEDVKTIAKEIKGGKTRYERTI